MSGQDVVYGNWVAEEPSDKNGGVYMSGYFKLKWRVSTGTFDGYICEKNANI